MFRLLTDYNRSLILLPFIYFLAACSSSLEHSNGGAAITPVKNNTSSIIKPSQQNMQPDDLLYVLLRSEYDYWLGSPYRFGGNSLHGIDCSSLVQQVFKNSFNIPLPRTTRYQVRKGYSIKKKHLKVGDLVFFKTGKSSRHVGIYMGNDEFFHVSTSKGTKISSLSNPYWKKHYWQSRRIIQ